MHSGRAPRTHSLCEGSQASMVHAKHVIVLVEDDGGMRQAVTRMLTGAGYTVRAFESAEALLEASAGTPLKDVGGCLVCDVRLPGDRKSVV